MAFPHGHKTVLILDRSPQHLSSSHQTVDFDIFFKNRGSFIPMSPVAKSLWTCSVEAAMEYARITYDIFPTEKRICLLTSDTTAVSLNSWSDQDQNLQHMMTALATHGPPDSRGNPSECNMIHGLNLAIQLMCQLSPKQQQVLESGGEPAETLVNRGRIVCLTAVKSEKHAQSLEECVQDAIKEHNKLAATTEGLMEIGHCDLDLVHVVPVEHDSLISGHPHREVSSLLTSRLHISQSGFYLSAKMVELTVQHYRLSSTTVTGIPMKEEQNASSSANYDVELLHSSRAHTDLIKSGQAEPLTIPSKQGLYTDTVTLKWCTPKSTSANELHHCSGAYRISPVDVNSRPSSCLTNFLLGGRSVLLEQPRKSGTRCVSHMLTSHGGEIYIHVLANSRCCLEDPPSISEGCGGRVTDYRINDFGELMKTARLAPATELSNSNVEETAIERARLKLVRMTRGWPLTISDTIVFNMQQTQPLLTRLPRDALTEEDVLDCRKAIFHLCHMETNNEVLPAQPTGSRGKGPKRDEQYRQMWNELERVMRLHASTSANHQVVLECLLECRRPVESSSSSPKKAPAGVVVKEEKIDTVEQSMKELDKYQKLTEREKLELNKSESKGPESPPIAKRMKTEVGFTKSIGSQSLLSLWTNRISVQHASRHEEFSGREDSTGSKAELYLHMKEENKGLTDTKPGEKGIIKKL